MNQKYCEKIYKQNRIDIYNWIERENNRTFYGFSMRMFKVVWAGAFSYPHTRWKKNQCLKNLE